MVSRLIVLLRMTIDAIAVTLFCIMFVIVLLQIFFRYFLGDPLIWTEEQAQHIFIWVSFLGLLKAAHNRKHIAMTAILDRLSPAVSQFLRLMFELLAVLFGLILAYYGWKIAQRNMSVGTVTLFYPFGVVYMIVPAAAIALSVFSIVGISTLKTSFKNKSRQ